MGFASDTAVEPVGGGRYATAIRPGWDIGGNANGGYLLSLAVAGDGRRRRTARPGDRHRPLPRTRRARRPAEVATEVVKQGRTFTTVTGALDAGGRRLLQVDRDVR